MHDRLAEMNWYERLIRAFSENLAWKLHNARVFKQIAKQADAILFKKFDEIHRECREQLMKAVFGIEA